MFRQIGKRLVSQKNTRLYANDSRNSYISATGAFNKITSQVNNLVDEGIEKSLDKHVSIINMTLKKMKEIESCGQKKITANIDIGVVKITIEVDH